MRLATGSRVIRNQQPGKAKGAFFFNNHKMTGKKIGLFGCYGGQEGKIFINYRKQLEGNEIIGEIGFKDPLKHGKKESELRAKEWASKY